MATCECEEGVIQEIASEEAVRHPNDIDAATTAAVKRIVKLPEYEDYVADLVRKAVREMIGDFRHSRNVDTRNSRGDYVTPAIVTSGKASNRVATAIYYNYYIGGRTLGDLRGEELPGIAEKERNRASGHVFNAKLCEALAKRVPEKKKVRQCVRETELQELFENL